MNFIFNRFLPLAMLASLNALASGLNPYQFMRDVPLVTDVEYQAKPTNAIELGNNNLVVGLGDNLIYLDHDGQQIRNIKLPCVAGSLARISANGRTVVGCKYGSVLLLDDSGNVINSLPEPNKFDEVLSGTKILVKNAGAFSIYDTTTLALTPLESKSADGFLTMLLDGRFVLYSGDSNSKLFVFAADGRFLAEIQINNFAWLKGSSTPIRELANGSFMVSSSDLECDVNIYSSSGGLVGKAPASFCDNRVAFFSSVQLADGSWIGDQSSGFNHQIVRFNANAEVLASRDIAVGGTFYKVSDHTMAVVRFADAGFTWSITLIETSSLKVISSFNIKYSNLTFSLSGKVLATRGETLQRERPTLSIVDLARLPQAMPTIAQSPAYDVELSYLRNGLYAYENNYTRALLNADFSVVKKLEWPIVDTLSDGRMVLKNLDYIDATGEVVDSVKLAARHTAVSVDANDNVLGLRISRDDGGKSDYNLSLVSVDANQKVTQVLNEQVRWYCDEYVPSIGKIVTLADGTSLVPFAPVLTNELHDCKGVPESTWGYRKLFVIKSGKLISELSVDLSGIVKSSDGKTAMVTTQNKIWIIGSGGAIVKKFSLAVKSIEPVGQGSEGTWVVTGYDGKFNHIFALSPSGRVLSKIKLDYGEPSMHSMVTVASGESVVALSDGAVNGSSRLYRLNSKGIQEIMTHVSPMTRVLELPKTNAVWVSCEDSQGIFDVASGVWLQQNPGYKKARAMGDGSLYFQGEPLLRLRAQEDASSVR